MDKETKRCLGRIVHELSMEVHEAISRTEKFFQMAIEAENCGDAVAAAKWLVDAICQECIAAGKMFAVEAHLMTLNGKKEEVGSEDD